VKQSGFLFAPCPINLQHSKIVNQIASSLALLAMTEGKAGMELSMTKMNGILLAICTLDIYG